MAMLSEVAGEMLLGSGSAIGQALVVLVVELVRASHCQGHVYQHGDLG